VKISFLIIFCVLSLLLLLFVLYETVILQKNEGYMNIYGHIFNIIIYVYIYSYKIFYRATTIILN